MILWSVLMMTVVIGGRSRRMIGKLKKFGTSSLNDHSRTERKQVNWIDKIKGRKWEVIEGQKASYHVPVLS